MIFDLVWRDYNLISKLFHEIIISWLNRRKVLKYLIQSEAVLVILYIYILVTVFKYNTYFHNVMWSKNQGEISYLYEKWQ